eukprot:Skav229820  [mRNA]  locus=scaffold2672:22606:23685:+ [translate_table: standard]
MPFGAARSVYCFLRVAYSLWYIGVNALGIAWSHFFDDFVAFSPPDLSANTEATVCSLFTLLGWRFAQDGSKSQNFAQCFGALGIQIDLSDFRNGVVHFCNTEKRVGDLKELIAATLEKKSLTVHESQKLRGKMQFADGQLMGRIGRLGLKAVTDHAFVHGGGALGEDCVLALERFMRHLETAQPRDLKASSGRTWFIFTDACYEQDGDNKCGLGGVLADHHGKTVAFFSIFLSSNDVSTLGGDNRRTIIFEAELLALLLSFFVFRHWIDSTQVVLFVDNNAVRDVSISGKARNTVGMVLIESLLTLELESKIFPWYARVPSPSNVADGPSRGQIEELLRLGASQIDVTRQIEQVMQRLR